MADLVVRLQPLLPSLRYIPGISIRPSHIPRLFTPLVTPLVRRYFLCLMVYLLLSSCASHYQHYSAFIASDSHGVVRQHRLIWESHHYPDWHWRSDHATPIRLESQCSDRVWWFLDRSMKGLPGKQSCHGSGIVACGDPERDLDLQRQALGDSGEVCMKLTDDSGARRIIDLDDSARLTVHCYPAGSGGGDANYPRASVVPYPLHIRRAPADSPEWHPPDLGQSACD